MNEIINYGNSFSSGQVLLAEEVSTKKNIIESSRQASIQSKMIKESAMNSSKSRNENVTRSTTPNTTTNNFEVTSLNSYNNDTTELIDFQMNDVDITPLNYVSSESLNPIQKKFYQ